VIDPSFVITHTVDLDEAGDVRDFPRQGGRMRQGRNETLGLVVAGVAVAAVCAAVLLRRQHPRPVFDYSDRSGFPRPAAQMRGAAARRAQPSRPIMA
jgi:hypothetical protein